ncbi:hypothetical protein BJY01DRAFT_76495 [Aspergillus pseudoustus]|uniref:SH3 domain-containing protein n=1 Tax=Aspergillus pseudoustus TaxID=1810923 RepID=A0ABR4J660_9EURO
MQSVQRQFGRLMKRSADDNQVAILLKDFDQVDNLLNKIVDSTKAWRDAWSSLLTHQDRMLIEFDSLYSPIIGAAEPSSHIPVLTSDATLARTAKLKAEYEDLRKELLEELAAIDHRMIDPATQARECLIPFKKIIKKRDDRKLDYERCQGRVDSYTKKSKRSDRENASLVKAEEELSKATMEYHAADEHLRKYLPPLITAIFSLLPRILSAQIEIQNKILAHYYTVIFDYCEGEQFPSDPPQPLDLTVKEWERACLPVQQKVEDFATLANGKAVRSGSRPPNDRRPSHTLNRLRSNLNLQGHQGSASAPADMKPIPAYNSKPSLGTRSKSTPSAPITHNVPPLTQPPIQSFPSSAQIDLSTPSSTHSTTTGSSEQYFDGLAPQKLFSVQTSPVLVGKKKPPPPPPKPRSASSHASFVTALYDFGGQSVGDLAFQTGDRIRVLKKTDSTDDWWEGELHGMRGSFPANYVE